MERWELVFKALSNINRLKILKILKKEEKMHVTDISNKLGISFMATSRHLLLLRNHEVLQYEGKNNHVFYSLNPDIPADFKKAINLVL